MCMKMCQRRNIIQTNKKKQKITGIYEEKNEKGSNLEKRELDLQKGK